MFVWVWCFAWIVWLLCACGVRRFRGLKRVSPLFYLFCLSFVLFLVLLLLCLPFFLPLCSCFLCLSSCPLLVLSLFVGRCFLFPFGIYAKRKGAPCWCVLSCPVVVRWLLSHHYNFSGFYSVIHPCHIVNRNKVSIPSVSVVIEANKRKI